MLLLRFNFLINSTFFFNRKLLLKARDLKVGSSSVSYRDGGNVQIAPPFNFEEVNRSNHDRFMQTKL